MVTAAIGGEGRVRDGRELSRVVAALAAAVAAAVAGTLAGPMAARRLAAREAKTRCRSPWLGMTKGSGVK